MAGKSTGFVVEPFNGHNDFTLWQQRVKDILTREGLVKALKKKNDKPAGMDNDKWVEMRELANSTIRLYLGNSTLREVINETDPAETWEKLESRHKSKSLTNRLSLKKQLYGLSLFDGGNFNEHLDEFSRLITELEAIGAKIEEEDKAIILLVSLPSYYEHIRTTLMYGKDTLTLDEVIATLLSHESMRRKESERFSEERVMVASDSGQHRGRKTERQGGSNWRDRSQSKGRSRSRGGESRGGDSRWVENRTCYFCEEEGHIMKFCPKLKSKIEKAKGKEKSEVSVVESGVLNEDDVFTVTSEGTDQFGWVMDSGCSFHMCSNRKYFYSYEACDRSNVRMANNTVNKVIGMGSVRFRMTDGRFVRLTGVRHVPGLRKNLISLGALHSNGCSFASSDGVLDVFKNEKVVMQGTLEGNLYKLQGRVDVRRRVTQVWRVKAQENELQCVESKIEKEAYVLPNLDGVLTPKVEDGEKCTRRRVTFATNLVADVFG